MGRITQTAILCCVLSMGSEVLNAQSSSPVPDDTLAEVGRRIITTRDLRDRIELMPWLGKEQSWNNDSVKVKALQSLAAEQILAMSAARKGMGDDSTIRMRERTLERILVRDELYKREVRPRVKVSNQEIRQGLKRFAWQMKVLMFSTRRAADARAICMALRSNGRGDSVRPSLPQGLLFSADTATITFGLLRKDQEDSVYALGAGRRTSEPFEVSSLGWVVLHFLGREVNSENATVSMSQRVQKVEGKIRTRKELELADRYYADILIPQRAEAEPAAFNLMARTLHAILVSDSLAYGTGSGYRLDLIVDVAEEKLGQHLSDVLVRMHGAGMTVLDVLEAYRSLGFSVPGLDEEDFMRRLNASVREVVAHEIVAREGYAKHLERTDAVERDVATWLNYWLAHALGVKVTQDVVVTDDEVVNFLVAHAAGFGTDYEVNVREILCDSLDQAFAMMARVSSGEDMGEVARMFSKRTAWAQRRGESGFFAVGEHPEIGIRALEADSGALVPPVRVPEGYSVFSVLGKKHDGRVVSCDSLKMLVRQRLREEKAQQCLNAFIATAAKEYQVRFHYDRLRRMDISPVNMVTRRMIGFGGSMVAVPPLDPLWEWVGEARDHVEILP